MATRYRPLAERQAGIDEIRSRRRVQFIKAWVVRLQASRPAPVFDYMIETLDWMLANDPDATIELLNVIESREEHLTNLRFYYQSYGDFWHADRLRRELELIKDTYAYLKRLGIQ